MSYSRLDADDQPHNAGVCSASIVAFVALYLPVPLVKLPTCLTGPAQDAANHQPSSSASLSSSSSSSWGSSTYRLCFSSPFVCPSFLRLSTNIPYHSVPKFFRWLSERYPAISQLIAENRIPEFDNLYVRQPSHLHCCLPSADLRSWT